MTWNIPFICEYREIKFRPKQGNGHFLYSFQCWSHFQAESRMSDLLVMELV